MNDQYFLSRSRILGVGGRGREQEKTRNSAYQQAV